MARLFFRSAYVDPLGDKTDIVYGRLVYRRVFLFRFVLQNIRCANRASQQLLGEISASFPAKDTIGAIARFLQVPGVDKGTLNVRRSLGDTINKEHRLDKIEILPLHTVPLLRPSRRCTIDSCRGSAESPEASQRMSQFDGGNDGEMKGDDDNDVDVISGEENGLHGRPATSINFSMEQLRLRAFSTPDLSMAWFFLDCYAPTAVHAASALGFVMGGQPSPVQEAAPFRWDKSALQELVTFFWEALQSLSSQVKHFYSDPTQCGSKPNRKRKKLFYRLSRVMLFHSISYWTIAFLQSYGFNPKALMAFSNIEVNVAGESQYERIKTLRLLSLSLRMRSKVPKLFGDRFHAMVSEKFLPVLKEMWALCTEMVTMHDSEDYQQMATPLTSNVQRSLLVGLAPIFNPFPSIYEAIIEFLPLAVDRVRKDVREMRKGYPASWPECTPPSSRKKKKGTVQSNTQNLETGREEEEVESDDPSAMGKSKNIMVLEELEAAGNSSDESCVERCGHSVGINSHGVGNTANGGERNNGDDTESAEEKSHTSGENDDANESDQESTRTKGGMCSDCKDCLYTFYCEGMKKGYTADSIGIRLWEILRHREQKKGVTVQQKSSSRSGGVETRHSNDCEEGVALESDTDNDEIPVGRVHQRRLIVQSSEDEEEKKKVGAVTPLPDEKNRGAGPVMDRDSKRRKIRKVSWAKGGPPKGGGEGSKSCRSSQERRICRKVPRDEESPNNGKVIPGSNHSSQEEEFQ